VRLTQRPPNDPVRLLLELCPAAARLVRYNAPSADNLVKDSLLAQATLTGSLIDLHSDLERLLDGAVRGAVRTLAAGNAPVSQTVRLLEELALLGGFTPEQISAAVLPSEAARAAREEAVPTEAGAVTIHVAQSVPSGAGGASHLTRLLLASQRAGTPILLTANADHDLALQVEGSPELANQDMTGVVVGVGPAVAPMPASFRLPARVEVSRPTRTIRLILGMFSVEAPTPYPVVVTLPAPHARQLPLRVTFGSSIQWPELTVRDWRALESANQIIRNNGARIELIVEEGRRQLGVMENPQGNVLFPLWPGPDMVQRALRGLDGAASAPIRVSPQAVAEIGGMTEAERAARWQAEEDYHSTPGRRVSSLFIRLTNSEGHPFDERFLRFLPFSFFPAPPFETDHPAGAEELRRQWTEGENDFMVTCFFDTDIHELATELRNWCQNPTERFPFVFQSRGTPDPVTRSRLTVRLLRRRERRWHLDRPIIFEFRPVDRREAYETEANYWRALGDSRRADLAQEICDRDAPAGSGCTGRP
jgi:hypothetical protein